MTTMHFQTNSRQTIDLGDGKTMRWSTTADTDNLAKLLSESFRWMPAGDPMPPLDIPGPNAFFESATRLMMSGKSSAMSEHDFALVEDKARLGQEGLNPIVACVALHRLKAYYGSVDMYFGKPELIATDPAYRNQGLIRKLLVEMIHPESEARGDALQLIPGIPYFYRQFGYEYSLCSYSAFTVESTSLDKLNKGVNNVEPFTLRRATQADIPLLLRLSIPANRHANAMVGQHYTQEYWQYTVHDVLELKSHRFDADRETSVIVDSKTGAEVGFTVMSTRFLGPTLLAMGLEKGQEYGHELTHSVLRLLVQWSKDRLEEDAKNSAEAMKALKPQEEEKKKEEEEKEAVPEVVEDLVKTVAATEIKDQVEEKKEADASPEAAVPTPALATGAEATPEKETPFPLELALHDQHPMILQLGTKATRPTKLQNPGMRLYTRIPSYPQFLLSVASELESRLAHSETFAGLTGLVRLDFFRPAEKGGARGLELVFENGRLTSAQDWVRPGPEGGLEERKQWKASGEMPRIFFASFPPMVFSSLVTGHQSLDDLYMMYGDVQLRNEESRELLKVLFPKGEHYFDLFCW